MAATVGLFISADCTYETVCQAMNKGGERHFAGTPRPIGAQAGVDAIVASVQRWQQSGPDGPRELDGCQD